MLTNVVLFSHTNTHHLPSDHLSADVQAMHGTFTDVFQDLAGDIAAYEAKAVADDLKRAQLGRPTLQQIEASRRF